MPSIEENRGWGQYDWKDRGDEWSSAWGSSAWMWHLSLRPRIAAYLPAQHILEIAPGHGRCTQFLLGECKRLTAVDLAPECVNACRTRFRGVEHFTCYANDGRSLPMVDDASVDLVFSWDSLVHAEAEVLQSYFGEIARVLRPGGAAFLHHSNLGSYESCPAGTNSVRNQHWRSRSMTASSARDFATHCGLQCVTQELVPWGGEELIDCWSTLEKPIVGESRSDSTIVSEHMGFHAEASAAQRLGRLYASPSVLMRAADAGPGRLGWSCDGLPIRYCVADNLNELLKRIPFVRAMLRRIFARWTALEGGRKKGDPLENSVAFWKK